MKYRIYFNRCFTTTSKLIEQIKQNSNGDTFDIVISHSRPNHYLEQHAVHFEVEPVLKGKDYADYIVSNCMKHSVEFFIPRFQVTTLVKHQSRLQELGIKAMFVASPEIYRLIDNKLETYNDLRNTDIVAIPETFIVRNAKEFETAYENIKAKGSKACIKPVSGIGGEGFKRILDQVSEVDELYLPSSTALSLDRAKRIFENDNIPPFMMSEFMEDEEYSIDCLAKQGELLVAVPRRKVDHYRQNIEYREELIEIAKKIAKRYSFNYLFNIQIKYHHGLPYLVEINTRFSGGMYKSGATGANLLYWAIQLLKDEEPRIPKLRWNIQIYDSLDFQVRPIPIP